MPRGGARSRSGPKRDPNALRRERADDVRDAGGFIEILASARVDEVPEFPLSDPSGRELEVWESLWARPQGVMWKRSALEWAVGLYVRGLTIAESADGAAQDRNSVRLMSESLGLTSSGLKTLGWKIVDDAPADAGVSGGGGQRGSSARGRPALKLVSGDAVEGSDS